MTEVKGLAAAEILRQEDVIKEFADVNNSIPVQVLSRLGFILNNDDDFTIKKEYREMGDTSGGAMLRNRLIQRYTDQPDEFTLQKFIDVLEHFNTNEKLRKLLCSKCNCVVPREGQGTSTVPDSEMIEDIKAHLQLGCENIHRIWGKLLDETSLGNCFVTPQIVNERGQQRRKETEIFINSYEELFQVDRLGDRIVMEADPGVGKTTYVNKLALDWTWNKGSEHYSDDTQFLQLKFTIIFLIPLRSLNGNRASTFGQAASIQLRNCGSWLSSKYQTRPSECLLILDAFDEYDGSCQEINEIINGSRFPRLKVIITTRPSHLERLSIKNQWLAITGLTTPEKRESFLIKQGWDNLRERNESINLLSYLGTLWQTPLYLAILCVLHKAKKVTGFDHQKPNCFHVLVKLFTEHIMSRKAKEGTKEISQLKSKERTKLKLYTQKCALNHFCESNPWLSDTFTTPETTSDSEDLRELTAQCGLLTIREEQSPITGETEETISFVHQLFLEYYAAVEFGTIFSSCRNKEGLVKLIKESLSITDSPFSYFLAAECKEYKEILVKGQIEYCDGFTIYIKSFPWLPQIQISNDVYIKYGQDGGRKEIFCSSNLHFDCSQERVKSFWDFVYVKELCSILKPKSVQIESAVIPYHDVSLDSILSLVNELELRDCNWDHINLDKQYPNLTSFTYSRSFWTMMKDDKIVTMLEHFKNLRKLSLRVVSIITDESIYLLYHSLENMNQLQELQLEACFKNPQTSVQLITQLAKTIQAGSLLQNLKKLGLKDNILDTETESSSDILLRAISKCVQLEELDLSYCATNVKSLDIIKEVIHNSSHLVKNLKRLDVKQLQFVPPNTVTQEHLDKWESNVKFLVPDCLILSEHLGYVPYLFSKLFNYPFSQ